MCTLEEYNDDEYWKNKTTIDFTSQAQEEEEEEEDAAALTVAVVVADEDEALPDMAARNTIETEINRLIPENTEGLSTPRFVLSRATVREQLVGHKAAVERALGELGRRHGAPSRARRKGRRLSNK